MQISTIKNNISNINNFSFNGIHTAKKWSYSSEQKSVINLIKNSLQNGSIKSPLGKDLYKSYDRRGYNFFLMPSPRNQIFVTLDKVKEDYYGKKTYSTKHIIGNFSKDNIDELPQKIKEIHKEETINKITAALETAIIGLLAGLVLATIMHFKK